MDQPEQQTSVPYATGAKHALSEAFKPVQTELDQLREKAPKLLVSDSKSGEEIIEYVCANIGKQIRPALFLLSCRLVGYRGEHLYPMAAVGEFVHNASLLHDDIVDNSPVRRNKPAPYTLWGTESAVLVGDLIYSTASELMAKTNIMEIVASYAKSIRQMSDGELIQLDSIYDLNISLETYLKIIRYKTATLLGTVCKSAGLLAGCNPSQVEALYEYGACIGYSFQIIDDALDYVSTASALGKHAQSDLAGGKVTYPIILLRECASNDEWSFVKQLNEKGRYTQDEFARLMQLIEKHDLVHQTLTFARSYTEQAKAALKAFAPSPERDHLEKIAHELLLRTV